MCEKDGLGDIGETAHFDNGQASADMPARFQDQCYRKVGATVSPKRSNHARGGGLRGWSAGRPFLWSRPALESMKLITGLMPWLVGVARHGGMRQRARQDSNLRPTV